MKRVGILIATIGIGLLAQIARADWTPAKRLTWNYGGSGSPAIAADSSGNLYLVWWDNTPGNYEIYYKKSTDGGFEWLTSQRLTWNSGYSLAPAIAVGSSDDLHVVWSDDTPGNYEIFYKKYST
jgi:hypothetical protein